MTKKYFFDIYFISIKHIHYFNSKFLIGGKKFPSTYASISSELILKIIPY